VLSRFILAYVLALPLLIGITAQRSGGHLLAVSMSSTAAGYFQVFFDTGQGFNGEQSVVVAAIASQAPFVYRVPIPAGVYRHLRIDPGTAPGRYVISRAVILGPDDSTTVELPLAALQPSYQLTLVDRTATHLTVDAPPGTNDPQLVFTPATPLVVPAAERIPRGTLRRLAAAWFGALLLVLVLEWASRPFADQVARGLAHLRGLTSTHPRAALVAVAAIATLLATYPVIFMGRSLVSPNNGGLRVLYDGLPGVPSSTDTEVEEVRLSDVWAGLYAFVPYSNVQREALRRGELPLWNRYNAAGRPLWGQGQTFLLDPLHWPTLVTPDPALGWDIKFVLHRFGFATGVGLAALLATGAWVPAALATLAAPFVSVYAFRISHPASFVLTYAPWVLLGWLLLARAQTIARAARAAILILAAMSLLLFGAPPKEAIATLMALTIAGGLTVCLSPGEWPLRARRLVWAALAGLLFPLVTAPHWMIFLDTLKRSATNYDVPYAKIGGVPEALAVFLSPLTPGPTLPGLHLLALVLILALVTNPLRLVRMPAALACAVAAVTCIVVAFGIIPVALLLKTPFIANIGHLDDVFITASVPLLLIAAAAGASILLTSGRLRVSVVTIAVLMSSLWLSSRVVALAPKGGFEPWAAGFALVAAVLCPLAIWLARDQSRTLPVVTALAVSLLLVLPGGLHARAGLRALDDLLVQPRPRVTLDTNSPAVEAMHRYATAPARGFGTEFTLLAGSQALYEVEGLGGPDALALASYNELVNAAAIQRSDWLTYVRTQDVPRLATLLDLVNARFIFSAPGAVPADFHELSVTPPDRLKLGDRGTAWPRAFYVDGITPYSDAADLLRLAAAAQRPIAGIQRSDQPAIEATKQLPPPSGAMVPARGYVLTTNSTRFAVDAPGGGVVVLTEAFVPEDFVATLNGRPVDYVRVNHAFKGVLIPSAGSWNVGFEYRPVRWRTSLALAVIGLLGVLGLAVVAWRT
jgi:hypothetical protein